MSQTQDVRQLLSKTGQMFANSSTLLNDGRLDHGSQVQENIHAVQSPPFSQTINTLHAQSRSQLHKSQSQIRNLMDRAKFQEEIIVKRSQQQSQFKTKINQYQNNQNIERVST